MSDDQMLKCLIAFILGYLLCKMMGNGFSVGGAEEPNNHCKLRHDVCIDKCKLKKQKHRHKCRQKCKWDKDECRLNKKLDTVSVGDEIGSQIEPSKTDIDTCGKKLDSPNFLDGTLVPVTLSGSGTKCTDLYHRVFQEKSVIDANYGYRDSWCGNYYEFNPDDNKYYKCTQHNVSTVPDPGGAINHRTGETAFVQQWNCKKNTFKKCTP